MWASTWALNGFLAGGVSQMTSCHRMEHELSAVYDITHGHGLAILIPRWLKYVMNDDNAWQIKRLGTNVFGIDASLSDREGAEKAIEALSDFFFKTLGSTAACLISESMTNISVTWLKTPANSLGRNPPRLHRPHAG